MGKKSLNIFVGLNDSSFQKGLKRVNKSLTRFGSSMKRVGSNLSTSVTAPLALAGGASLKMAVDFESSMTKIMTLVGATNEQMQQYSEGVAQISSTTAIAQKDLADGLFFITSAGLKGEEALAALDVSAKAAAMGMGEMDSIANALTSVMTAYADENMTSAKAGDLLHETLKQGKFEAGQFMDKLGSVIPVAAAAGVSFEELGAASATMSKLSGDASGTLTSMKALIMGLLKPSEKQKEILDQLGLSTDDLGSMMDESLMGTLQFLFKNLEGNNEALTSMFGSSQAVTGALATMGLQAETYAEVLDGMNKSQGNVNNGMQILNQTAGQQLKQSFVDLQNAGIEIGNILLPVFLKLVNAFKSLISGFTNLDTGTKQILITLGIIAAGIGPLITLVGSLATAFAFLSTPIGLVVVAVGVLAAAFVYAVDNWGAIKERFSDVGWWQNALISMVQFFIKYNPFSALIEGYNGVMKLLGQDGLMAENLFVDLADSLDGLKTETKDYENDFGSFSDAITNAVDKIKKSLGGLSGDIGLGSGEINIPTTPSNTGGGGPIGPQPFDMSSLDEVGEKNASILDKMKIGWDEFGSTAIEKIQAVAQIFGQVTSQMEAASNQRFSNEFANLDIQTQKEIQAIETSSATEKEKQDKIADIEKGADKKRKEIQLRQAKANKKFAIMSAIVNTAMAVTNALANIPSPFNIPVAIAMGAAGAAQVAAIASTPLPALAEGGLAFGPTAALVGDNVGAAADPEVIAPLSKLNGMLGGNAQKVIVEGVISGEDIYLVNKQQETTQKRFF